ncbi:MAG: hypothetical protein J3R72DRAFT_504379 [Linnemannia gamsii]|nr:MAG: hypothetical protein J3R72DRAFT_504379 [Linnemannia gamsii]
MSKKLFEAQGNENPRPSTGTLFHFTHIFVSITTSSSKRAEIFQVTSLDPVQQALVQSSVQDKEEESHVFGLIRKVVEDQDLGGPPHRLQYTHQQPTNHPYYLVLAISRLLDVMVESNVKDLSRVSEYEHLVTLLTQLSGNPDMCLKHQAI